MKDKINTHVKGIFLLYNCFHKWKSENGDDVETVVECNPITFSGGKGGEREGEKKGS